MKHVAGLIAVGVTHSLTGQLLYKHGNVLKLLIRQKDLTTPAGLKQKRNQWLFYPTGHRRGFIHLLLHTQTHMHTFCSINIAESQYGGIFYVCVSQRK